MEIGVVADDLTGGAKVAALLESVGVHCPLLLNVQALNGIGEETQAVVIGRKLLAQPPTEAVADALQTARELIRTGVKQLYFKYSALFSSTARGNIGPIAEALMNLTNEEIVLFCPARPARNATVYQGRLFLGQRMLHETPRRFDPITPMTNANLVELLQSQSTVSVGLLPLQKLRGTLEDTRRFLAEHRAAGTRFFIVDAVEDEDLNRVAALVHGATFTTGSDDLPQALSKLWPATPRPHRARNLLPPAPGHVALISGSCTPKSNRQLDWFERNHPVHRIDLERVAYESEYLEQVMDWAREKLPLGPIAVATTTDATNVQNAQEKFGTNGAAALAEQALCTITQRLHRLGARKFLLAGGETSGAILTALGAGTLEVAIHDDLQGGYCHYEGDSSMAFVLKAGATGDENFYDVALTRLAQADSAAT